MEDDRWKFFYNDDYMVGEIQKKYGIEGGDARSVLAYLFLPDDEKKEFDIFYEDFNADEWKREKVSDQEDVDIEAVSEYIQRVLFLDIAKSFESIDYNYKELAQKIEQEADEMLEKKPPSYEEKVIQSFIKGEKPPEKPSEGSEKPLPDWIDNQRKSMKEHEESTEEVIDRFLER